MGEEPFDPLWPPLSVTAHGVFTQEATPLLRDPAGAKTEVVLPPESNAGFVAAAGAVGVASTDGALIVFDLRSGTELHQIALGRYDAQVTSLAVSPAGDVAATVAVGDGSDVLLWAPAGARARARARDPGADGDGRDRGWADRLCGFEPPRRGRAGDGPRRSVGPHAVPRTASPRPRSG